MNCAVPACVFADDGIAGAEIPIFDLQDSAAYFEQRPYRGFPGVTGRDDAGEAGFVPVGPDGVAVDVKACDILAGAGLH